MPCTVEFCQSKHHTVFTLILFLSLKLPTKWQPVIYTATPSTKSGMAKKPVIKHLHSLYSTPFGQSMHQIKSLYIQPFDRCSRGTTIIKVGHMT